MEGNYININILQFIEGAKKARGVAVIIDVFRAFSFECYVVKNGAEGIIPVASKERAYALKQKNPGYILAGERKGRMLPGFDYGNSPSQIEHVDLSGRVVVHTTSAGTQGLENAAAAREVIAGSLVNARAVAEYLRASRAADVSLVCMGNEGVRPAEEDNVCAEYIKALLENRGYNIEAAIKKLKYAGGQKFFDPAQSDVFPERDFHLCTAVNAFDFILKFEYDASGLGRMRVMRRDDGPPAGA